MTHNLLTLFMATSLTLHRISNDLMEQYKVAMLSSVPKSAIDLILHTRCGEGLGALLLYLGGMSQQTATSHNKDAPIHSPDGTFPTMSSIMLRMSPLCEVRKKHLLMDAKSNFSR